MKKILNKLLEKQSLHRNKNSYYLSIYYPVTNETRNNIDTHLKSYITEALRDNKRLSNKTRLHKNIVNKVLEVINSTKSLNKGCGIFIEFNARKQEKGRLDEILDENFNFIRFSVEPKKQIFIGNVYSLSQLIWLDNISTNALVVNIVDKNNCDIYEVDDDQVNKLTSLGKSYASYEKDFMRAYKPTGNIATTHGTGSNVVERNEEETLKRFITDIVNHIESSKIDENKYKYLVVFYSKPFSKIIETEFKENLSKIANLSTIFIRKNISDTQDLLKIVNETVREHQKTSKIERFHTAKSNYSQYSEGWKETTSALNKRKVSQLFIKPIEKEGYINLGTNQLYTYPQKGTIKIKNITPYAVISTINNGGEVVLLQKENFEDLPKIASELRYAKKRQNRNNNQDIRRWVTERKGTPSIVKGTEDLLRIKFSDTEIDLEEISWDRFFNLLNKNDLLFIYDKDNDSRFNAFIDKN
jgi:hypothetical protein